MELVRKYLTDITVISLHPTGLFVAVGFSDQLRLMDILIDDLKVQQNASKTIFEFIYLQSNVLGHQNV